MNQNEYESIDTILGFYEGNLYVENRNYIRGSQEAEQARCMFAALAYQGMKEGFDIYRKVNNQVVQIFPEVDYPYLLELEKFLTSDKSNGLNR